MTRPDEPAASLYTHAMILDPPLPRPVLDNSWETDALLQSYLQRYLSAATHVELIPSLEALGGLAAGELYQQQLEQRRDEPLLTRWNPWGERVDEIRLTPLWQRAKVLAAEYGLVARGYSGSETARIQQFALAYLFIPSTDFYGCPLAMTDGAARALMDSGADGEAGDAVQHLLSTHPDQFWTSGQWMTETAGGSDVSNTRTIARLDDDGRWRLYGRKWFTSAITSEMALALARPEGSPEGLQGLAMFYVPLDRCDGPPQGIEVLRLKDKLGTRKLPTAELKLDGAPAQLIGAQTGGIHQIVPMLNVTRVWNSVTAASLLRRGLQLARDYARKREAGGRRLIDQPLHQATLAELAVTSRRAFHLAFDLAGQLGAVERGEGDPDLLRLLTALVKLTTARQAVAGLSEVLECFGGAGYVEDTGLPQLLRDAQVLPIWEGTTNVLALDAIQSLSAGGLQPLRTAFESRLAPLQEGPLQSAATATRAGFDKAASRFDALQNNEDRQASARFVAQQISRCYADLLLLEHARWCQTRKTDPAAVAAARCLDLKTSGPGCCDSEDLKLLARQG